MATEKTEKTEKKRTRLYSRRGDLGETSLLFGPRVGKDHYRVVLLGTLDELNAVLGLARAEGVDPESDKILERLQRRLFEVGAEAATLTPEKFELKRVDETHIRELEELIDATASKVEPTRAFVLPGGAKSAATLHFARTVCRRAERRATALLRFDPDFSPRVVAWLNRVGTALFVLARYENVRLQRAETEVRR